MSPNRVILLLALTAVVACSDPVTGPDQEGEAAPVTISPSPVSLRVGETLLLRISGVSTRLTAIWTSENPTIAAVAIGGLLKGMQAGHTRITARAGDVSASVEVTVLAAPDTAGSACPSWAASRCQNPRGHPRPF
jgi:hypothetical protein